MVVQTEVLFKLQKLVKKTGILNDLKSFFKKVMVKDKAELEKIQMDVGADLAISLISNIDGAENEFYDLIATLEEKSIEDVKKQDLEITIETLKELFQSKVFKSFLSLVSK